MNDASKTKADLIKELKFLRQQNNELSKSNLVTTTAEKDIKDNENYFESLFENAPLAYQSLDTIGNLLEVNEAWCLTFGYEKEEVIGRNIAEFIHPDFHEHLKENFPRFKKLGQVVGVEFEMIKKDGTQIIIAVNGKIGYHPDQSFKQTHCILHDITERKEIEDNLRASEEFNRAVIENSPLGISVRSANGKLLSVNKAWKNIWNFSDEQVNELSNSESDKLKFCNTKQSLGEWLPKVKNVYEHGGFLHIPKLFLTDKQSGKSCWVSLTYYSINDFMGNVDRVVILTEDITERKLAENSLRESEQWVTAISEQSAEGISVATHDGDYVFVNPAFCKMMGYTEKELLKLTVFDMKKDIGEKAQTGFDKSKSNKDGTIIEVVLQRKDKSTFISEVSGKPIKIGEKNLVLGMVKDITERKQAEEAMRESQEHYKNFFDNALVGFFRTKISDGTFTEINSKAAKQLGLPMEEIIGKMHSTDLYRDTDQRKELLSILKRDGVVHDFETEMTLHDGRDVTFSISVKAYPDNDYLEGVVVDITERKQSEEALKISEEKFRSIAERTFDVITMAKIDGTITYVSPSISRVFGHQPADLIGKKIMDFVPESVIPDIKRTFKHSAAGNIVEPKFSQFLKADSSVADVEINAIPIFKKNQVTGTQAIIRDISETKRLQEQESRASRLESAGQVAGQIAHDFNNLLAPLVAYPDFVRDALPKDHPALKYINDMEKSANKIAEINQQLLTLSRRGHYNEEALNLNEIIQFAIGELGILPQTIIIETDFADNLMNIKGGSAQISRVLSNLIYNARDAMQDVGNIKIKTENYYADNLKVNYGLIPKGEYVKVTLSDIGCGISDDVKKKIFDPFFTTKSSDKRRGSGLGLSVVDAVMKDHGGYIDLKSALGEGTSFYLYFPITRESVEATDEDRVVGGTESVLVIDDDKSQCEVALMILKKLGYKATAINDGEEAVEFLKNNPQELVLLDMIMPDGIDGTETFRRILETYPNQKAIIVSGFAESERVEEACQLGIDMYIRKPLTLKLLASCIRRIIEKREVLADNA